MFKLTLQTTWAHKRRLVGTFLAVLLGVSFLAGTLVLGDTLRQNFDDLFNQAFRGTDVVVKPLEIEDSGEEQIGFSSQTIDGSLVSAIESVPGVRAAAGEVTAFGQLIDKDGERIGGNGPPTFAGNWVDDPGLNPYRLVEGSAPVGTEDVILNRGAAKEAGVGVGDTVTVLLPEPLEVTVTGLATFGDEDGSATTTYTAFSDAGTAAHLQREPGRVSDIVVAADDGVSQDDLADRVSAAVGDDVRIQTGQQAAEENITSINEDFLGFFTTFLVVFAAIALLVASFSIYNTFSILVAQRTRESALLRAIGASKRQVLGGTLLEALIIGVVASVIGLGVGVLLAQGLKGIFDAFGLGLPAGGIAFTTTSIVLALVVGITVTVLSALGPARRAARVAPVEALRESAVESRRISTRRIIGGAIVAGLGLVALLVGVFADTGSQLGIAGLGALGLLVGMVVLGPVAAGPAGRFLGGPLARLGITGSLARENAVRNPRRTASTAAALMVGVAVVVLFATMISSATTLVTKTVDRSFGGDLVVSSGGFGPGTLPPTLAAQAADLEGVATAVGTGDGSITVDGQADYLMITDPGALAELVDLDQKSGSMADVGVGAVAISEDQAEESKLAVGDSISAQFPDGATETLQVRSVYGNSDLWGDYVVDRSTWEPHTTFDADSVMFVELEDGASIDPVRSELAALTKDMGRPEIQDRQEYTDSVAAQLNQLLGLIVVMLALAIIIALMGIANTLALSVHERSREIGVLRAVGTTRRQMRRIIRWESVIIATFGTLGGIALGVLLGWGLVTVAFADAAVYPFTIPIGTLVITIIVGVVAGVLAAARPARRAAKRDVLAAIATP